VRNNARIIQRLLGISHILVAIVLLPTITFLGYFSILIVIPGLIWLIVLGIWLWRPGCSVRKALRVTHFVLAPLAVLLVAYGLYCLRAAQRSAEGGGGLLGAVGLMPIVMGVLAWSLSIVSLFVLNSNAFRNKAGAEQGLEGGFDKSVE
jgi:hypothetical protein